MQTLDIFASIPLGYGSKVYVEAVDHYHHHHRRRQHHHHHHCQLEEIGNWIGYTLILLDPGFLRRGLFCIGEGGGVVICLNREVYQRYCFYANWTVEKHYFFARKSTFCIVKGVNHTSVSTSSALYRSEFRDRSVCTEWQRWWQSVISWVFPATLTGLSRNLLKC